MPNVDTEKDMRVHQVSAYGGDYSRCGIEYPQHTCPHDDREATTCPQCLQDQEGGKARGMRQKFTKHLSHACVVALGGATWMCVALWTDTDRFAEMVAEEGTALGASPGSTLRILAVINNFGEVLRSVDPYVEWPSPYATPKRTDR